MGTSELFRRIWVGYWVLTAVWLIYTVVKFGILADDSGDEFLRSLSSGFAIGVLPPAIAGVALRAVEALFIRRSPPG
jgi:hypothetical protein